ncbi:RNA-protein complex protein Nop10 [Candidatus Woesearchaeota archaeon]|nr:RNA-protein complex protein Nop10 [Candidatus Woesearchaeota archaeon]
MKIEIRKCPKCLEYTLKSLCEKCKSVTITIKPAKYSPEDRYGRYRRLAKKL